METIIKSYDKVDDKLSKKLADLICISTNAYETFKGSTIVEKRDLLNFMFSNLTLEGCKLHYVLAFPFTEMQKVASCTEWRRERDSNPRYGYPYNGLANRRLQPLGHLSKSCDYSIKLFVFL